MNDEHHPDDTPRAAELCSQLATDMERIRADLDQRILAMVEADGCTRAEAAERFAELLQKLRDDEIAAAVGEIDARYLALKAELFRNNPPDELRPPASHELN